MPNVAVKELALALKTLSDENRLKILSLLGTKEQCICYIYESLGLPQNLLHIIEC